jgi:uncharacterized membrane protein YdbT with pleckstrin-like domain
VSSDLVAQEPSPALPAGLVADDEIVILMLRPSLLFVVLSSIAGLSIIAVVSLTLALLSIRIAWVPWSEAAVYALGVGGAAILLLWQSVEWYGLIYVLTDRRVIRRSGIVRESVFEAPLRTIQHTSVFQPLLERLLGLGSIGFATAGSDVFDAFWVAVRRPFAVHKIVADAIERYGGQRGS